MQLGEALAAMMLLLGGAHGAARHGARAPPRGVSRSGPALASRAAAATGGAGLRGARVRGLSAAVMSTMAEREAAEPGFYVTTPIYYVNDKPHIGHAYTTVASDAFARFNRLDGKRVRFVTGTDEHGQKVQQSAEKAGVEPQAFTDRVSANFRSLAALLLTTNDDFVRTTEPRHKATVRLLWDEMLARGHIYKGAYEGWYSVRDEAFYAENELVDGKAPTGAEVAWLSEPSYFFRLSAFAQPLLELYAERPGFIMPPSRRNEMLRFVEGGLQDLSISRTAFSWGIPVPDDPEHVIYVWLDALTNYLTASGYELGSLDGLRSGMAQGGESAVWPPTLHVVGKDILRFHTVFWPAFLLACGLEVPGRVFAHGWWTIEGAKMSKSVGNVVDPFELVHAFGVDAVRYFLLTGVPFGADGDYSRDALVNLVNANLANQMGNLLHRTMTLVHKNCGGCAPLAEGLSAAERALLDKVYGLLPACRAHMEAQAVHRMADELSGAVRLCNEYIDMQAPWSLRTTDPGRMRTVLWTLLESLRCIGILMGPLTPQASIRMLDQLGVAPSPNGNQAGCKAAAAGDERVFAAICAGRAMAAGTRLPTPTPVFPRIDVEEEEVEAAPDGAHADAPRAAQRAPAADDSWLDSIADVEGAMRAQGEVVRALKAAKADKEQLEPEVAKLLKLKGRLAAAAPSS